MLASDGRRRFRAGFTLVELLVVIAIIGVLAALLIPAVQAVRARAKLTECMNNLGNVGKAVLTYESSKQKFPGSVNLQTLNGTPTGELVNWAPLLLQQLGRNDLYTQFISNQLYASTVTANQPINVPSLVCPLDSNAQNESWPLSYSVNGGRANGVSGGYATNDYRENGVFFNNHFPTTAVTQTLSYIAKYDGATNTIMAAEDMGNGQWTGRPNDASGSSTEYLYEILWQPVDPAPVTLNSVVSSTGNTTNDGAVPRSLHAGGFPVAMCDGSVKFMGDLTEYRVYSMLMTPFGEPLVSGSQVATKNPTNGSAQTYPTAWYNTATTPNRLKALTESDIK